ncbi:uncharacterized protein LOC132048755 [Lycium ferocissimum]|uniref:uncharacterized protein LOC132048755 n=1 Tax=Lycium ferocissimum TaxID=112874 RepID=UPI002815E1C8|nr:uncharacterized protein LOC132048755 [Lycium ferocissimum]
MATRNQTRSSCARVKVEVDLLKKFPKRVNIGMKKKSGEIVDKWLQINYDYVPKYCQKSRIISKGRRGKEVVKEGTSNNNKDAVAETDKNLFEEVKKNNKSKDDQRKNKNKEVKQDENSKKDNKKVESSNKYAALQEHDEEEQVKHDGGTKGVSGTEVESNLEMQEKPDEITTHEKPKPAESSKTWVENSFGKQDKKNQAQQEESAKTVQTKEDSINQNGDHDQKDKDQATDSTEGLDQDMDKPLQIIYPNEEKIEDAQNLQLVVQSTDSKEELDIVDQLTELRDTLEDDTMEKNINNIS